MAEHTMCSRCEEKPAAICLSCIDLLKQPKCKTCGDRKRIHNPEYQPPRFLDECETYTTPSSIPCPDCQQPKEGEFTKKWRNIITGGDPNVSGKLTQISGDKMLEACDIIDSAEARLKAMYAGDLSPESRLSGYKVITDQLNQSRGELLEENAKQAEKLDSAEARLKVILDLLKAFVKYGNHRDYCNLLSLIPCIKKNGKEIGCTCGFASCLSQSKEGKGLRE